MAEKSLIIRDGLCNVFPPLSEVLPQNPIGIFVID
jgi:hypothetical protein